MSELQKLNRAVQSSTFPSVEFAQSVRDWIEAATERMEPASEPAKVECPNCGEMTSENHEVVQSDELEGGRRLFFYTCEQQISELDDRHNRMASPEYQAKVKADMARRAVEIGADRLVGVASRPVSETVTVGTWQLEELLKYADYAEVALRTGFHPPDFIFEPADRSLRQCIDAIKEQRDQWRTRAAQPAKVRMTEELERVLATAVHGAAAYMNAKMYGHAEEARLAIAAVRAQAAEAGKVRMPKVPYTRDLLSLMRWQIDNDEGDNELDRHSQSIDAALAEIDAAEGKGEGRG